MPVLWRYMAAIIGGFCIGGIMFSRLLPRLFLNVDVTRVSDDHNPGTVNVIKYINKPLGFACMALDIGKGWLPLHLAYMYLPWQEPAFAIVMIAPVLGHALAPFDKTHGGKAIATAFGVMIATLKVSNAGWVLAALFILFSTLVKVNPHSRRVVVTYLTFAAICVVGATLYTHSYSVMLGCLSIAGIVIWRNLTLPEQSSMSAALAETEQRKAG